MLGILVRQLNKQIFTIVLKEIIVRHPGPSALRDQRISFPCNWGDYGPLREAPKYRSSMHGKKGFSDSEGENACLNAG